MSAILDSHYHGKGRVRLVKVIRNGAQHTVREIQAQVLITGPVEAAYERGDNSVVLPTDTVKNTCHALARKHDFESLEDFAMIISRHFLTRHPTIINHVDVTLVESSWVRAMVPDSTGRIMPHNHAFTRGAEPRWCRAVGGNGNLQLSAGFTDYQILKTTQSGFENFVRDEFTTLQDARDRLVGTKLTASWTYAPDCGGNFEQLAKDIKATLLTVFSGPADTGEYSASVQATMHDMAAAVLSRFRNVSNIEMTMPNVHNLPIDMTKFGLTNDNNVLLPIDEPHGIISASFKQPTSRL